MQREIQDAAYQFQRKVERGEQVIVGVNRFVAEENRPPGILRIDAALQARQIEKLRRMKEERDRRAVDAALAQLRQAVADPDARLMEPMLTAVEAYCSLGEIVDVLTDQYGRYQPPAVI